jgi:uncharacterized SAM-binding protein YcdF (DUF218 family)
MTQRADAIVVLGCRVRPSGEPTETAQRRVLRAAQAYAEGVAPRVVASGGRRWGEHAEALVLRRALLAAGVPEQALSVELCSMTTSENAFFTARLLTRAGLRRVAIVSCAWHVPRALANFETAGLAAVALPALPPDPGPIGHARRWVHEAVAKRLDSRSLRRLHALSCP